MKSKLIRESDATRMKIVPVSAIIGVVVFFLLLYEGVDSSLSSVALALPVVCLGVGDLVLSKRWFVLIAFAIVSAVCLAIDVLLGIFVALLLFGACGASCAGDVMQRALLPGIADSVEHMGLRKVRTTKDCAIGFVFDIPCDIGAGTIEVNDSIRRNRVSWRQVFEGTVPAFAIAVFSWIVAVLVSAGAIVPIVIVSIYAVTVTRFFSMISVMDVRIKMGTAVFRLGKGLMRTSIRILLTALILLLISSVLIPVTEESLQAVAVGFVAVIVVSLLSYAIYSYGGETEFVTEAYADWLLSHPAACEQPSAFNDGVPGTPRRSQK